MSSIIFMVHAMLIVMNKNPKLKICDHVTIWKYKNLFAIGYTPN